MKHDETVAGRSGDDEDDDDSAGGSDERTDTDDSAGHESGETPAPELETREAFEELEAGLSRLEESVRRSGWTGHTDTESDEYERVSRSEFEAVAGRLQDVLAELNGGHGAINRRSGGTVTPVDPESASIELADIAHALSNLSRFTGQGTHFYSVARHAVHVSHEVDARGGGRAAQRWGLLHDASEAYLSDVPAPVKRSLPGYTRAEKRLQGTIQDAFDLALASEDVRVVDAADNAVGRDELATHFPNSEFSAPELAFAPEELDRETDAEALFLDRASELGLR